MLLGKAYHEFNAVKGDIYGYKVNSDLGLQDVCFSLNYPLYNTGVPPGSRLLAFQGCGSDLRLTDSGSKPHAKKIFWI